MKFLTTFYFIFFRERVVMGGMHRYHERFEQAETRFQLVGSCELCVIVIVCRKRTMFLQTPELKVLHPEQTFQHW